MFAKAAGSSSFLAPRPARFPSSLDRAFQSGKWPVYIPADDLWLVESSTRAELDHIVQVFLDGTMSCTCEAGQHGQADCLHRAGVGYCILHGVRGALHYCANCHSTRVARAGAHCIGCTQLIALAAEPVREPLPFPTQRLPREIVNGMRRDDPLFDLFN